MHAAANSHTLHSARSPRARAEQGEFDFLIPVWLVARTSLNAKEVGQIIGYKERFVEREAELGHLEHYGPKDRDVTRRRYTMIGVLTWVAERIDTTSEERMKRIRMLLDKLSAGQREEVITFLIARRGR